ncbi:hypothetical protein TNCV_3366741 [Trichonephila clavipes]|nr:hypothetical protein TNCV_3366741 [Trichonephila clavipes]
MRVAKWLILIPIYSPQVPIENVLRCPAWKEDRGVVVPTRFTTSFATIDFGPVNWPPDLVIASTAELFSGGLCKVIGLCG